MPQIRPITDLRNTAEISDICHADLQDFLGLLLHTGFHTSHYIRGFCCHRSYYLSGAIISKGIVFCNTNVRNSQFEYQRCQFGWGVPLTEERSIRENQRCQGSFGAAGAQSFGSLNIFPGMAALTSPFPQATG